MNKRSKVSITVLAFSLLLMLAPGNHGAPVFASEKTSEAGKELDEAVSRFWLDGFGEKEGNRLREMARDLAEPETRAKAVFHAACADLMAGKREAAQRALSTLEGLNAGREYLEALRKLLGAQVAPEKSLSLDIKDVPLREVLRMVAQKVNQPLVIGDDVPDRMVSLHLPKVEFDQVLQILSKIGNFKVDRSTGILLVTYNPSIGVNPEPDGRINLDLKDGDLPEVIKLVAGLGKLNVVLHRKVLGRISIKLDRVVPQEALRLIARAADLYIEKDGDALLVVRTDDLRNLTGKASSEVVPLKYLEPADAVAFLNAERIPGATILEKGRGIRINSTPELVEKARSLLAEQDKPQSPIMINMKVWELVASGPFSIEDFERQDGSQKLGSARILSSPQIFAMPGGKASTGFGTAKAALKSAEKSQDSGYQFEVRPVLLPGGLVQIDMKAKITTESEEGDEKKLQTREWASSMVVKPGNRFFHQIQGGERPIILEMVVGRTE